jgi:hypothetical protein
MTYLPKHLLTKVISYLVPRPNPKNCMDTIPELKAKLRQLYLKVGGTKLQLIQRLLGAGQYARRPFWDTKDNAHAFRLDSVCPRPLLTFDVNLHSEASWNTHLDRISSLCQHELILSRSRHSMADYGRRVSDATTDCERVMAHYRRYKRNMRLDGRLCWQRLRLQNPSLYHGPYRSLFGRTRLEMRTLHTARSLRERSSQIALVLPLL